MITSKSQILTIDLSLEHLFTYSYLLHVVLRKKLKIRISLIKCLF